MFDEFKNAINRMVVTEILVKKGISFTTVNQVISIAGENDIYKRRVLSKIGGFCYALA